MWSKVVEVRGYMAALRPIFDLVNSQQTQEEADAVFAKRFQNFVRALGETKDAIFESEPFISEEIYKELHSRFLLAAEAEKISVATTKHLPKGSEWIEQGETNNANLQTSAAKVSALIRARLAALTVAGRK